MLDVTPDRTGSWITIRAREIGPARVVAWAIDTRGLEVQRFFTVTVTAKQNNAPLVDDLIPDQTLTVGDPSAPLQRPTPQGLNVGDAVVVQNTGSLGLNVRSNPWVPNDGTNNGIGNVSDGATGTIRNGTDPDALGRTWWEVEWDASDKVRWIGQPPANNRGWSVEAIGAAGLLARHEPESQPFDLEIRPLGVRPNTVVPGGSFTLSVTVHNNGPGVAPGPAFNYYHSRMAGLTDPRTPQGAVLLNELKSGENRTEDILITAPDTPGTYYYGASLVPNSRDKDSGNDAAAEIRVTVSDTTIDDPVDTSDPPDLIIESISADPKTMYPGVGFTVSATVRNAGGRRAANVRVRYYRSSDEIYSRRDDTELPNTSDFIGGLVSGETSDPETANLDAPDTPGTYYYIARVEAVRERNTANNYKTVSITVLPPAAPDLVVSLSTTTRYVDPGGRDRIRLEAIVNNQGKEGSAETTLRYYLSWDPIPSPDNRKLVGTDPVRALRSADSRSYNPRKVWIRPPPPELPAGVYVYYYYACVDSVSAVRDIPAERNTDNNCSNVVTINVRGPDLVVNSVSVDNYWKPPNTTVRPDGVFELSAKVKNQGTDRADNSTIHYYISSDALLSDGDTKVGTEPSTPKLDPNETSSKSIFSGIIPPHLPLQRSGFFYVLVCVDAVEGETDTDNNCHPIKLTVANFAPRAVGTIPPQTLTVGTSTPLEVSRYFSDANEDTLTYTVNPNDLVETVSGSGAQIPLTAKRPGSGTITITASDGALTTKQPQTFEVEVLGEADWMPDAELRAAVRDTLGLAPNDALTLQAIQELTSLRYLGPDLRDTQKITALTGLEHAVNLEHLDLYAHLINDLRPLERLTKLRSLWIAGNKIANIRPLTSLPLERLDLGGNPIADFAPLSDLTRLTRLDFWGNGLGNNDLSIITGLTQLTELDLRNNQISDVTPLTKLVNLKKLQLEGNPIADTASLLTLTGQNPDLEIDIEISDEPPSEPDTEIETEVADLVVELIRAGKTTVDPGAVFRVDVVIRNQGKAPSGDTTVGFYRSQDETVTTDDTQVNRSSLMPVAVDGTKNKWARLTAPKTAGVYYYGVCVGDVADESNTENNCSTAIKMTVGTPVVETPVVETPVTPDPETGNQSSPGASLAQQVFDKHKRILQRQDVKEVLPNVFTTLKAPDIQALLTPATINLVVKDPDLLKTMVPTVSDTFITLMKTDTDIQKLLSDSQVQTVLQTPTAIDELAKLLGIRAAPSPPPAPGGTVVFRDPNLAKKVREALNLPAGAAIPKAKLATLTRLDATQPRETAVKDRIKDLTGLEHATQLTVFKMYHLATTDLTALAGLTKLEQVSITSPGSEFPRITNLSPFKRLTNLKILHLYNIDSTFAPLTGLTKVEDLALFAAEIDDNDLALLVPMLVRMKNLRELDLGFNAIQDVTPLAALVNLKRLVLWENPVTDASLRQLKLQNPGLNILGLDIPAAPANNVPVTLLPDETALLSNYPNPFNPETWIPYRLAKATDVTVTIYDVRGGVVWRLTLGHQPAGFYQRRARAAYWDGRNASGEQVASGVYFYQLETDEMSLMRKMIILK